MWNRAEVTVKITWNSRRIPYSAEVSVQTSRISGCHCLLLIVWQTSWPLQNDLFGFLVLDRNRLPVFQKVQKIITRKIHNFRWLHIQLWLVLCVTVANKFTMSSSGLSARSRSLLISDSIASLIASLHALWQISVKSAPLKPWVVFAR